MYNKLSILKINSIFHSGVNLFLSGIEEDIYQNRPDMKIGEEAFKAR
jgi:hypothetical protein